MLRVERQSLSRAELRVQSLAGPRAGHPVQRSICLAKAFHVAPESRIFLREPQKLFPDALLHFDLFLTRGLGHASLSTRSQSNSVARRCTLQRKNGCLRGGDIRCARAVRQTHPFLDMRSVLHPVVAMNVVRVVAVDLVETRVDVILGALDSEPKVLERFAANDDLVFRGDGRRGNGRCRFLRMKSGSK